MKYGYCTNHHAMYAVNAKRLCGDCTKERHIKSAESKGLTVKEKNDGNVREWERRNEVYERQDYNLARGKAIQDKKAPFKQTPIKPRSEKNKEIIRQELFMFKEIWDERKKECEHCKIELTVWHPILFHHIRTKGSHPELRLVKENIALICAECHIKEHGFKPRKLNE